MEKTEENFIINVRRILQDRDLSQRRFAGQIGVSYEHLNSVLKGRTPVSRHMMHKIAEGLGESLSDLLTTDLANQLNEQLEPYGESHLVWAPYLEAKEDNGKKAVRASHINAPIAFKADWAYQLGSPENMVFVKTMGTSLGGEIPDNALVLVDRAQRAIIAGSPYCIRVKGEIRIKRLVQGKGTVLSYNDKGGQHDAEELRPDEDWEVIGRCVWYSKALT